jgi:hypothetical protein
MDIENKNFVQKFKRFLPYILLIATLIIFYNNNQKGRYALYRGNEDNKLNDGRIIRSRLFSESTIRTGYPFYILDTQTGRVWYRYMFLNDFEKQSWKPVCYDFGTTNNPTFKVSFEKPTQTKGIDFSDLGGKVVEEETTDELNLPEGFELEQSEKKPVQVK